jgi:hypothetical protein
VKRCSTLHNNRETCLRVSGKFLALSREITLTDLCLTGPILPFDPNICMGGELQSESELVVDSDRTTSNIHSEYRLCDNANVSRTNPNDHKAGITEKYDVNMMGAYSKYSIMIRIRHDSIS